MDTPEQQFQAVIGGSNDDSASLKDNEPLKWSEVPSYGVVIELPQFFVHVDEYEGTDVVVQNKRAIPFDRLVELIKAADDILSATDQTGMGTMLIKRLRDLVIDDISRILLMLGNIDQTNKSLELDDQFVDVTSKCLSFDVVRKYINDPITGVLIDAEAQSYDGIELFSQLDENDPKIAEIRTVYNDNDYNRAQLYIKHIVRLMLFEPGYICETSSKLTNLALLMLCLVIESRPIEAASSNDLRGNILGFMFDVVARSRLIQHWQRNENTRRLLEDMIRNYNSQNYLVKLCQLPSAAERAQYFINILKKQDRLKIVSTLDFSEYANHLHRFKHTIEGQEYYLFGLAFITSLSTSTTSFNVLKQLTDPCFKNGVLDLDAFSVEISMHLNNDTCSDVI